MPPEAPKKREVISWENLGPHDLPSGEEGIIAALVLIAHELHGLKMAVRDMRFSR